MGIGVGTPEQPGAAEGACRRGTFPGRLFLCPASSLLVQLAPHRPPGGVTSCILLPCFPSGRLLPRLLLPGGRLALAFLTVCLGLGGCLACCLLACCLLAGCLLAGCLLTGCLLTDCLLTGCLLTGCLLTGCLLTLRFRPCSLLAVGFLLGDLATFRRLALSLGSCSFLFRGFLFRGFMALCFPTFCLSPGSLLPGNFATLGFESFGLSPCRFLLQRLLSCLFPALSFQPLGLGPCRLLACDFPAFSFQSFGLGLSCLLLEQCLPCGRPTLGRQTFGFGFGFGFGLCRCLTPDFLLRQFLTGSCQARLFPAFNRQLLCRLLTLCLLLSEFLTGRRQSFSLCPSSFRLRHRLLRDRRWSRFLDNQFFHNRLFTWRRRYLALTSGLCRVGWCLFPRCRWHNEFGLDGLLQGDYCWKGFRWRFSFGQHLGRFLRRPDFAGHLRLCLWLRPGSRLGWRGTARNNRPRRQGRGGLG